MQKLVLFDFDGTLADSAPDLAAAANRLRLERGLEPLPYAALRPYASHGARGLLKVALDINVDDADYEAYKKKFLLDYEQNMTQLTTLFDGVDTMLAALSDAGLPWGIVTNKTEYLTRPLVEHLGLSQNCVVLVGGDTTPHIKPHPASLLHAAAAVNIEPRHCIYIGDDQRDIQAGKAANMTTVVAAYGYCDFDPAIATWEADNVVNSPTEVPAAVEKWATAQV